MEKKQGKEQINKLVDKLNENKATLNIARIPYNAKKKFVDLADKEFCGDYGMTLKWLIDDLIDGDMKLFVRRLIELEQEIEEIKEMLDKKDEKKEEQAK